jgi:hypothetical protein
VSALAVDDLVSDAEYMEPVPPNSHEFVCPDCHLVSPKGHGHCTNCELWPPTTNPKVLAADGWQNLGYSDADGVLV